MGRIFLRGGSNRRGRHRLGRNHDNYYTKIANRAVAGIICQLNDLLVGEDPSRIDFLWHKTFRSFTYTGSRGATTNVISGIDIALWDIQGKVLGKPIYALLGGKSTVVWVHISPPLGAGTPRLVNARANTCRETTPSPRNHSLSGNRGQLDRRISTRVSYRALLVE